MSERDPIWIEGPILTEITNYSVLTYREKELLLEFQKLFAQYAENDALYRRLYGKSDEASRQQRMSALNSNLALSSDLYKLLGTTEIKHILELHSLGRFSSKNVFLDEGGVSDAPTENHFCWKCGAKLIAGGDFCIKCGAKATAMDESDIASSKPHLGSTSNQRRDKGTVGGNSSTATSAKLRAKIDPEKRNKIIKISILVAVAVVILVLIINSAVNSAQNAQLRNFATETMNEDYTNVYADVVSMEPEYFVYTSYNGGSYMISEVVCKCETVEGKYIWAAIDSWDYPGGGSYEDDYEPQYYNKYNPLRLTGRVKTAGDVIDKLESSIGDVLVLSVKDLQE